MTEIERLKEEIGRLTAEVGRLKGLLDSHGISWQPVQVSAKPMDGLVSAQERDATALRRPKPMDTAAEKARRLGLFIQSMKREMRSAAIDVREMVGMNCHFAVMDEDLVWYGSMNFLSREHEDDILMRLRSEAIAEELMMHGNQQKAS